MIEPFVHHGVGCRKRLSNVALVLALASVLFGSCTQSTDPPQPIPTVEGLAPGGLRRIEPAGDEAVGKRPGVQSAETAETALTLENTGLIEGTIRFTGRTIPTSTMVPVGTDPQYCGHQHSKEDYVIDARSRGVRYVIVRLKGKGLASRSHTPPGHLLLDNKECRFEPHAAVLTVGSTIELHNSDEVFHTMHAYFGASFNIALPARGTSAQDVIEQPGITKIQCDKHGWMNAFIYVGRHPFHAVTDAGGRFKISDVPAGKYTLVTWHEQFGSQETPVVVVAGETTKHELTYPAKSDTNASL